MKIGVDKIYTAWLNILALVSTSDYYSPNSDNDDIELIANVINNYIKLIGD